MFAATFDCDVGERIPVRIIYSRKLNPVSDIIREVELSVLIVKNMKAATCECGHEEAGATEKDVMTKMESHMRNEHPALASDMKKMLKKSEKTMRDAVASM